jgi:hypothetical protein
MNAVTQEAFPIQAPGISQKYLEYFFLAGMILNGILPQIIPGSFVSPLFMGMELILIPWALLFFPISKQVITLIAFAFLGYEYPLILATLLFIPAFVIKAWKAKKLIITRPLLLFILLIIYALLIFILNSYLFISFSGLFFWILTFIGPIILLFYLLQFKFTQDETNGILHFFKKSILIQFPIILAQAVIMKSIIPGDWAGGSMLDAHNCGIFIALYGLTLILPGLTQKGKPFPLSSVYFLKKALPALFFLLITDAKTIYLVVLVSLLIFLLFTWLKNTFSKTLILSSRKVFAYLTLLVFSFLLIPILAQAYVRFALDNSEADLTEVVGAYLFDEENTFNQKAVWYKRVFSEMKREDERLWWTGTGPGNFGSRAANTLAYDVMYKESQKIPSFIPPVSSPWTRKHLGDLMTSELAEMITFHSTFLAAPVSGIVALKAELGWPGLILFCLFTFSMAISLLPSFSTSNFIEARQTIAIFWIIFPLLMLFDNYQEKPVITFPLMILSAVLLKTINTQK